ncbi:MAG TPA: type II secretion system F family protein [Gammaproteobacteria bacterium]|nr:type II secretion system F family protein [Gammaproteobacteria bacterium]
MNHFRYKAACADGSVVDGVLSGADRDEIVAQLRALDRVPIRIDEAAATPSRPRFGLLAKRRRKITEQQVADMTRELATLLRAGMPLDRAIETLIELAGDHPMRDVLADIVTHVKKGETFADSVAKHASVFDDMYVSLLRAGELGGALEATLERLADHMDVQIETRSALTSALIYPALLIVVAVISLMILLGYVVPQFTEMFDSAGQTLPLSTRVTIAIGEFLKSYGWMLVLAGAAGLLLLQRQLKQAESALAWHRRLLRLPIVGAIVLKSEVGRFARTLSMLLQNGIPMLKALSIVADTMTNLVLAEAIGDVTDRLKQGQSLAQLMQESELFPLFAVQMIKVGEESGTLPEILTNVGIAYERDTRVTIKRALTVLEPLLILVLGAIIAAVIISILVAIVGINELVI